MDPKNLSTIVVLKYMQMYDPSLHPNRKQCTRKTANMKWELKSLKQKAETTTLSRTSKRNKVQKNTKHTQTLIFDLRND